MGNKRVGPPTVLAFGDLSLTECCAVERVQTLYKGMGFENISGESPELKALQGLYGKSRSRFYRGAEARKTRVTAESSSHSVLHFGTPAILDQYQPMQSLIVLSPESKLPGDGLLKLWEVTELNSRAQVVSFSNSSIAQQHSQSGNAFIALSWAWFVSGTPAVELSRWRMDQTSVNEIASEFHRGLMQSRVPANALQQGVLHAKRASGREHPYYWSGFMVIDQR
jgi:CHAT domain-containing protein